VLKVAICVGAVILLCLKNRTTVAFEGPNNPKADTVFYH